MAKRIFTFYTLFQSIFINTARHDGRCGSLTRDRERLYDWQPFRLSCDTVSFINLPTTGTHISWSSRFKHNARTLVYLTPRSTSVPANLACPIAVDVAFKDIQDSVRLFPQHWTLTAVSGEKKTSWGELEASDALKKTTCQVLLGKVWQMPGEVLLQYYIFNIMQHGEISATHLSRLSVGLCLGKTPSGRRQYFFKCSDLEVAQNLSIF